MLQIAAIKHTLHTARLKHWTRQKKSDEEVDIVTLQVRAEPHG